MIQFKHEHITVFQSCLYQTTSTVINTEDFILIVDPNWLPHEIEEIRQHVNKIKNNKTMYLFFTHSDFDHIIGYQAFPEAITIASTELRDNPNKQKQMDLIYEFDNEYYIKRKYPICYPSIDIAVEKNYEEMEIKKTKFTFYKAKGHTFDSIFLIIDKLGLFIAGDYLSDFEFPFIDDHVKNYEKTLSTVDGILNKHEIKILIPGHGQTTMDIEEIKRRKEFARSYIQELKGHVANKDFKGIEEMKKSFVYPSKITDYYHQKIQEMLKKEYEL